MFLQRFALPVYGGIAAIEGWVGPLDAEQDFRFADAVFEIKTVGPDALRVKISSAEQLDDIGRPLQLVVAVLDHADPTDAGAFCLSGAVAELRDELQIDPQASALFDDRLLSAGYFDRDEYRGWFFRLNRFRRFAVNEGFPRIIQSGLPPAIDSVRYELDLQACLPYEVIEAEGGLYGA